LTANRSPSHGSQGDVMFHVNEFPAVTKMFSAINIALIVRKQIK